MTFAWPYIILIAAIEANDYVQCNDTFLDMSSVSVIFFTEILINFISPQLCLQDIGKDLICAFRKFNLQIKDCPEKNC